MKQSKITFETLKALKDTHGEVFVVEADMRELSDLELDETAAADDLKIETAKISDFKPEQGVFYAILKKPNNKVKGFAMTQRDPVQMGNVILKNCILEADDEILGDEDVNFTAAMNAVPLIKIGKGKLKKY